MIIVKNVQQFSDLDFAEYLRKPGYSQSFLKRETNGILPEMEVTDNMRLGSMVDAILTEPHKVDVKSDLYYIGREMASVIRKDFGQCIDLFQKQINYLGEFEYEGWTMPVKGRLDFLIPKHCVIDLKCTTAKLNNIQTLVEFMGYKNQLWIYSKLSGVKRAYLLIYSRPDKKTKLFAVDVDYDVNNFWAEKIIKFGSLPTV